LTSSREDTLVSHFQQRENAREKKTLVTYGLMSSELLTHVCPECASLKTLTDTYPKDCKQCSQIWKAEVTKHRGEYSARLKSEHLTREKECLYWPTPATRDYKGGHTPEAIIRKDGKHRMDSLPNVAYYIRLDWVKNKPVGKSPEQLNPDWVEQLMGLTVGQTDLGCWGME